MTVDRVTAYLATGDLGARVRRGCGNWLFLMDELELHRDRAENAAQRLRIIEEVAAYLKARHIGLVVAPVPDKSRVQYARDLCGVDHRHRSAAVRRFRDAAQRRRDQRGGPAWADAS